MCGIAGIFKAQRDDRSDTAATAMQQALKHRGPDDAGLWSSPATGTTLAHTRLSILDLSAGGHQPMSSPDGRYHVTFNGEIYNFRELRRELESTGTVFHTQSDTEVLLRLYERDGAACLGRLRGMFAFAIWDERERRGFMARDRFGIKPLYWTERDGTLVFASELRALLASGMVPRTLHTGAVQRYFETGSVPEPMTLVRDANLLEAGCSLIWHETGIKSSRWWNVHFEDGPCDPRAAVKATRAALLDSVEHHFVSDVPVGIFLSGGIDSTALLSLARVTGRDNVRTFSMGVDDAALDESSSARRTAEHFGTEHVEARLDAVRGRTLFAKFLNSLDQPSIDGFNTFCVSGLAREHGMKVVLSGLGGDELFAGYASFTRIPKMLRWHQVLRLVPGIAAVLDRGRPQHRRMADFVRSPGTVADAYAALRGIFSKGEAASLTRAITGTMADTPGDRLHGEAAPFPTGTSNQISALELTRYMRNQLLKDSDVMSMAHSLELRVPLVDSGLFDSVSAMPDSIRLKAGKKLLLASVSEIPEWIACAPKRGFLFPYQKWLETDDWKATMDSALAGLPVRAENWYMRWSIFVFRRCCDRLGLC